MYLTRIYLQTLLVDVVINRKKIKLIRVKGYFLLGQVRLG